MLAWVGLLAAQNPERPAAVVNGLPITEQELREAAATELDRLESIRVQFEAELQRNRQTVLEVTLKQVIENRLLQTEASKRGLTVQSLLQAEVDTLVKAPSDEAVQGFYETNKARMTGPIESNAATIREYLRRSERQKLLDAFIKRLEMVYAVTTYLEPARRSFPDMANFPSRGPADAPVTIVEFADFECPYCARLHTKLRALEKNNEGKIRLVYRQFPLPDLHPHAVRAAEASLCAYEQHRFWEFHDSLFADQKNLDASSLREKAKELSLDMPSFTRCLDSEKYATAVRNELADGAQSGVHATPTIFINGRYLAGDPQYDVLAKIVEEELEKAKKRPNQP
jgi:protein-disulfide isomerase